MDHVEHCQSAARSPAVAAHDCNVEQESDISSSRTFLRCVKVCFHLFFFLSNNWGLCADFYPLCSQYARQVCRQYLQSVPDVCKVEVMQETFL